MIIFLLNFVTENRNVFVLYFILLPWAYVNWSGWLFVYIFSILSAQRCGKQSFLSPLWKLPGYCFQWFNSKNSGLAGRKTSVYSSWSPGEEKPFIQWHTNPQRTEQICAQALDFILHIQKSFENFLAYSNNNSDNNENLWGQCFGGKAYGEERR